MDMVAVSKRMQVVSGIGNTLGTAASYCGPIFVGQLLQRFGGWDCALLSIAAINVLALVSMGESRMPEGTM